MTYERRPKFLTNAEREIERVYLPLCAYEFTTYAKFRVSIFRSHTPNAPNKRSTYYAYGFLVNNIIPIQQAATFGAIDVAEHQRL